jgi:hypothetical protein
MKILKLSRDKDFVRFSFNVEIEESPGLIIKTTTCGSMEYLSGMGLDEYSAPCIDDVDWMEISFLGKIVDHRGFREMYNKLFKEDFDKFEKRVDDKVADAIHQQIEGSIIGGCPESLKRLLKTRYFQVKDKMGRAITTGGSTYAACDDWTILALMRELGTETNYTKNYFDSKGVQAKYNRNFVWLADICECLE